MVFILLFLIKARLKRNESIFSHTTARESLPPYAGAPLKRLARARAPLLRAPPYCACAEDTWEARAYMSNALRLIKLWIPREASL